MNLPLLQQLLSIPSPSRREVRLVEFLRRHVEASGLRDVRIHVDALHNLFLRKGTAPVVPCVAAHLDTVHREAPVEVLLQDGALFGVDKLGRRTGCGGDDRAGLLVCLELLERCDDLAVAFFAQEEIGCIGARHAPAAWFGSVSCVVEFDCPGRGLLSRTSGGVPLAEGDDAFLEVVDPVLAAHGYTTWQDHPYTDVQVLRQRFGLPCLNLSCGYHDWHRPTEHVVVEEVAIAIEAGVDLVEAIGTRRHRSSARSSKVTAERE